MVVSTKINLLGCRIACKINLNWIKGNVLKLMWRDYLPLKIILAYEDKKNHVKQNILVSSLYSIITHSCRCIYYIYKHVFIHIARFYHIDIVTANY